MVWTLLRDPPHDLEFTFLLLLLSHHHGLYDLALLGCEVGQVRNVGGHRCGQQAVDRTRGLLVTQGEVVETHGETGASRYMTGVRLAGPQP